MAIGTHDMSAIEPPFVYDARPPADINFVPLVPSTVGGVEKTFNAKELLDWYRTDPEGKHLKPYTDYIYDSEVYVQGVEREREKRERRREREMRGESRVYFFEKMLCFL